MRKTLDYQVEIFKSIFNNEVEDIWIESDVKSLVSLLFDKI